jgi:hypothetical protein
MYSNSALQEYLWKSKKENELWRPILASFWFVIMARFYLCFNLCMYCVHIRREIRQDVFI